MTYFSLFLSIYSIFGLATKFFDYFFNENWRHFFHFTFCFCYNSRRRSHRPIVCHRDGKHGERSLVFLSGTTASASICRQSSFSQEEEAGATSSSSEGEREIINQQQFLVLQNGIILAPRWRCQERNLKSTQSFKSYTLARSAFARLNDCSKD